MQDLLRRTNFSQYAIYVGFLLIFVIFSVALHDDGFLTRFNLFNIVQQAAPITIMSIGTVFVLTAGEIDLSIGSIVAVTALIAAVLLRLQAWPIAVAGGLFTGALIGALNGALRLLRTSSFLPDHLGHDGRLPGHRPSPHRFAAGADTNETFNAIFGSGDVAGIPSLIIWTIVATLIGWFFLPPNTLRSTHPMPRAIARMPHGPPASRCCGCGEWKNSGQHGADKDDRLFRRAGGGHGVGGQDRDEERLGRSGDDRRSQTRATAHGAPPEEFGLTLTEGKNLLGELGRLILQI